MITDRVGLLSVLLPLLIEKRLYSLSPMKHQGVPLTVSLKQQPRFRQSLRVIPAQPQSTLFDGSTSHRPRATAPRIKKYQEISHRQVLLFIMWLTDFACCDWSIPSPLVAVRTSSSRSPFQNRNNQQSHIINILLASFDQSVGQGMDPRFFLPFFHGPRASCLSHKTCLQH